MSYGRHGTNYLIPAALLGWAVFLVMMFQWPTCERTAWSIEARIECMITEWHGPYLDHNYHMKW